MNSARAVPMVSKKAVRLHMGRCSLISIVSAISKAVADKDGVQHWEKPLTTQFVT